MIPGPHLPPPAHLVVGPAGLPDAQGLSLRELPLETQQEPSVAEQQLEPILAQGDQVLVEARVGQPEQLPQVQLEGAGRGGALARLWGSLDAGARKTGTQNTFNPKSTHRKSLCLPNPSARH